MFIIVLLMMMMRTIQLYGEAGILDQVDHREGHNALCMVVLYVDHHQDHDAWLL